MGNHFHWQVRDLLHRQRLGPSIHHCILGFRMSLNNQLIVIQRSFLILILLWMTLILKLQLQRKPNMIHMMLDSWLFGLLLLFSNLNCHLMIPNHLLLVSYLCSLVRSKLNILISILHWSYPWMSLVPMYKLHPNCFRCTSYSYRRRSFCMILLLMWCNLFHIQFSSCSS